MFRYGTNAVSRPTSRRRTNWILVLVIALGFIALAAMRDGHTEYGYTENGGRL